MLNLIRKFIYDLIPLRRKGLEFEPPGDGASPKYRRYREEHGQALFGYVPPPTLGRAKKMQASLKYPNGMLTYQGRILSCTMCTICELKNYFTNWKLFFSWRWLYGLVRHFNGGTRFKDGMRIAKKGILLDTYLPQRNYWGGERFMQKIHLLKKQKFVLPSKEELTSLWKHASLYRLKSWAYIYSKDQTAIKHAVQKAPCPAGVYLQRGNWFNKKRIKYQPGLKTSGGHLILIVDWSDIFQSWWITDHDGKGLKLLNYNYPFAFIASVTDGRSGQEDNTMLRVIKTNQSSTCYVVWKDNTRSALPNWEFYIWGCEKGLWVYSDKIEILKEDDLHRIPLDNQSRYLLMIMGDYTASHNPTNK